MLKSEQSWKLTLKQMDNDPIYEFKDHECPKNTTCGDREWHLCCLDDKKRMHTWSAPTHQALVTILASQAWLRHTQAAPACDKLFGGTAEQAQRKAVSEISYDIS
jgi:hypothetical protein